MDTKPKVLVAEDDEFTVSLFAELEDYDITIVQNGDDCLTTLEKQEFDVAILDVLMPKTSGLAVLRTIKKDYPDTAVIVVTGYGDILRPQITEIGVDGFVEKPFTLDIIKKAVNAALESRQNPSTS